MRLHALQADPRERVFSIADSKKVLALPRTRKIDLSKVCEALTTTYPKWRVIQPSEVKRLNFEDMLCLACGSTFQPTKRK